jgi:hypothetical protein
MPTGIYPRKFSASERFWLKVRKTSGCWIWIGSAHNKNGYGMFWYKKNHILAHRYSWLIHKRKIPKGLFVLHKCDNPPCVNPKHLWIGNQSENMLDCSSKHRHGKNTKLTKKDVAWIRENFSRQNKVNEALQMAAQVGISRSYLYAIARGCYFKQ